MRPLADKMRPSSLEDFLGQEHLLKEDSPLYQSIKNNRLTSMIFWGPPGVGKTSLANVIARETRRSFIELSAVSSGVKDVRNAIESAKKKRFFDQPSPLLFIDEIHRFNKNQQDALLGAVESGTITLIGATTENPSFEVNNALLSRCQVYTLRPLDIDVLKAMVNKALAEDLDLKDRDIEIEEWEALLKYSAGDARKLYNVLELATAGMDHNDSLKITNDWIEQVAQSSLKSYDKTGEFHYDLVSAFIKSVRGSDPDAALYWMARMIDGGEDPKFICRRLIILAAEDIGLANPNALLLANACMDSIQKIGMPEGRIVLSQTAIYLASSPKSNSAYLAINQVQDTIRNETAAPVPLHLRNAPTQLMKELDYGKDYLYPHDFPGNFRQQQYLPEDLKDAQWYRPQKNSTEAQLLQRLQRFWPEKYGKKGKK